MRNKSRMCSSLLRGAVVYGWWSHTHPFHSNSTLARLHHPSFTQEARQRSVASRCDKTCTANSGGRVTRSGKLFSFNPLFPWALACCWPLQEPTWPICYFSQVFITNLKPPSRLVRWQWNWLTLEKLAPSLQSCIWFFVKLSNTNSSTYVAII